MVENSQTCRYLMAHNVLAVGVVRIINEKLN